MKLKPHTALVPTTLLVVGLGASLTGCNSQNAADAAAALARAEVFDFYYLKLSPDAAGDYILSLDLGSGCEDFAFTELELADMLNSKQFPITQTVGGRVIGVNASFAWDALTDCASLNEVKYETDDLSVEVRNNANEVIGRDRPEGSFGIDLVDVDLDAGQVSVLVFGNQLIGQNAARTNQPGALTFVSTAKIDGNAVGGSTDYEFTNVATPYIEASLDAVLTDPPRFTTSFAFLAKTASSDPEILLVWDGDLVLRTDL